MEREDVIYHAKDRCMTIQEALVNCQLLRVWEKGYPTERSNSSKIGSNISSLSAGVFLATIRRAQKSTAKKKTQLFSVTMADIKKSIRTY